MIMSNACPNSYWPCRSRRSRRYRWGCNPPTRRALILKRVGRLWNAHRGSSSASGGGGSTRDRGVSACSGAWAIRLRAMAVTSGASDAQVRAVSDPDRSDSQADSVSSLSRHPLSREGSGWRRRLQPGRARLLTPENTGWVGFDLVQYLVDRAGLEVVIAVPAAVAVGPVQAPVVGAGAVAQLGHPYLGPFGQVRVPRRTAVKDGDRVAADGGFDADLVAKARWDPGSAVLADPGNIGLWRHRHPTTLGPSRSCPPVRF